METPVVRDELRHLLSSWWETPGRASLEASAGIDAASWGGGVQILSVTEARSLTFEHLFVLGLNRHHFPRTVREDPLLPDSLRTALTRVLPDLAVRRRSFDEERYLFAQLLAAAPHRTLSWASADRDGRSLPTSPLVDRLRYRPGIDPLEVAAAPEVAHPLEGREAPSATADRIPQTLWHHLLAAGVAGERETFEILLAPAWREALDLWPSVGLHEPVDPTAAWVKTLAQLAPDLQSPEGQQRQARLGPFFGLVGFDAETARRLHVTALEQLAACPWQTYLQRVLRLVPSLDPLLTLPALTPPLVGRAVHEALECLAANQLPPAGRRENTVSHARQRSAAQLEWPSDQELDRLLLEAAETTLSAAGIRAAGLRHALAARLRPFVDVARQLDEADPTPLLGSEVRGELELNDTAHPWRLAFQVDRIERLPQGGLRLTDFKTGRPPRLPDQRAARHEALLRAVRQGRQLQAATYALAATAPRQPAEGRYVYLRPADEPIAEPASPTASLGAAAQRLWSTAGLEPRLRDELPDTLERLAQLWRHGAFFPRLVEPKEDREPRRCSTCSVAEACLRGDSGARRRLRRAVEDARADPQQPAWMEALLEVWDLPLR